MMADQRNREELSKTVGATNAFVSFLVYRLKSFFLIRCGVRCKGARQRKAGAYVTWAARVTLARPETYATVPYKT